MLDRLRVGARTSNQLEELGDTFDSFQPSAGLLIQDGGRTMQSTLTPNKCACTLGYHGGEKIAFIKQMFSLISGRQMVPLGREPIWRFYTEVLLYRCDTAIMTISYIQTSVVSSDCTCIEVVKKKISSF